MPKLSIIVPIYNVELYLSRCLDSILEQTYKDFELILIEDGSPDNCGRIIDQYAKKDRRIITIHQINKGVSAARNAGLNLARGEYIGFVDPDDWIEPDMYSDLIRVMTDNKCEIASCSWFDNDDYGNSIAFSSGLTTKVMSREEYMMHLFDSPITISGSVCCRLFRRSNITGGFSENYSICEDNLFVADYCSKIERAIYVNKALYHVYHRQNSATRMEVRRPALGLPARREIISIAKTVSLCCGMKAEMNYLNHCISFSLNTRDNIDKYQLFAQKELLSYMTENPFCLFKNRYMTLKQKLFFLYKIIVLLAEKGR